MNVNHPQLVLAIAILCSTSTTALAASFQILEQSPAHLGTAFAGTASNINDATTVFFNPAGMAQLDGRQISVAGNLIFTQATFHDRGSNTGGLGGKTEEIGIVPNFYGVQPLNEDWTFGLGINAPFGLVSDYGEQWMGRYLATFSELQVININPTFAYRVNDQLSFGIGINYQHAEVTLESRIDSSLGINPNPATDSSAQINGSDYALSPDLSIFYRPVDSTSFGLVWRKGARFSLEGDATFSLNEACSPGAGFPTGAPPAPTTGSICAMTLGNLVGAAQADVRLPDTITLSASHQLNEHWAVHSDIAWTEWSKIQTIEVINQTNNATIDELELNYNDTVRYALGATYAGASAWTWRAGIALDEAPQTNPQLVNPRIPDQDRTWLSLGFNYAFSKELSIDVGYAHLLIDKANIEKTDAQTGHILRGDFDAKVDIVGVQANWQF
jgi:long-chain fatty acid transport protein